MKKVALAQKKKPYDPTNASEYVRLQTEEKLPKPFDTLTKKLSAYLTSINDDESSTALLILQALLLIRMKD